MTKTANAAAIYCRISDDTEGTGKGVERQRQDCIALADRLGWTVADTFTDNDISAYSGKRRPEYERMLADLEAGVIDGVIAWHPDRIHRRPAELEHFIDVLDKAEAPVSTVLAGDLDLSTSDGRLRARITGAVARHESEHKSERIKRKALELAKAGKVSGGGTRPFGFESDRRTIRADEAQRIREAAAHILGGGTLWGLCNQWNDRSVPTVTGARWTTAVLRRLLTSGRIAGWREHHGELVAEAEWPAIIDRADLERLRAILTNPARRTNGRSSRYLLTGGLARCGLCGEPLIARGRGHGTRGYTCATQYGGCGKIRCQADPLEAHVVALVLEALSGPDVWRAMSAAAKDRGTDDRDAIDQIAADEAKLEELAADYYVNGAIKKPAFLKAQEQLEARIAANLATLAAATARPLQALNGDTHNLAERWEALSFDNRRSALAGVLDRVDVNPAVRGRNFFTADRVAVAWRY